MATKPSDQQNALQTLAQTQAQAKPENKDSKDSNELSRSEVNDMIQHAILYAEKEAVPELIYAISEEKRLRELTTQDLLTNLWKLKAVCQGIDDSKRMEERKKVLENLNQEKLYVAQLNKLIANKKARLKNINQIFDKIRKGEHPPLQDAEAAKLKKEKTELEQLIAQISIPVSSNKMENIIEGAMVLIEDDTFWNKLLNGEVISACEFDSPHVTILANQIGAKGNSKETYFKCALRITLAHFTNQGVTSEYVDASPSLQLLSIPKALMKELPTYHSNFFFSDRQTENGILTDHSLYAYGGHRVEIGFGKRYQEPHGKPNGTLDCSSGSAKNYDLRVPVTTFDLLCNYRLQMQKLYTYTDHLAKEREAVSVDYIPATRGFIPDAWLTSPEITALSKFEPVLIEDHSKPSAQSKPGDWWSVSRFNKEEDPLLNKTLGGSGHTGMLIGYRMRGKSNPQAVILGPNRDMPANPRVELQPGATGISGTKGAKYTLANPCGKEGLGVEAYEMLTPKEQLQKGHMIILTRKMKGKP